MELIMIFYYIFIIFLNLLKLNNCQKYEFKINLRRKEEYCLSEYFPVKTLVIFKIYSEFKKLRVQMKYENEIRVSKYTNEFLLPITTEEGGNYELCVMNMGNNVSIIYFTLKYGVGAKDYSSLARTKDLKPVDLALEKLNDRAKDLSKRISFSQSKDKNFENILDNISSKIMIFSFIIVWIMIFVGLLEIIYLKNFMRKRKII